MESSLTTYTMEVEYYRPNSNSAEDNDASIYWLRVLSASLGIWPQKLVGDKKQWWKRLYYFMIIMHWYNTYLQVEFFFHNLGALKTMTEGLCSFCSISLTGIKIMRLNSFSNEINLLLERMRTHHFMKEIKLLKKGKNKPIFERIDQIMKDKWKEVKINLLLYTVSVGIVASSYSIFPAVINLINLFQGSSNPRRFVYKTYYRGMENLKFYSPLHEILFSSESLSGYTTFAGVIAFDGLYVLLTMHVITIFKSLKLVIKESTRSIFTDEEKQCYLHECIDHYTRAIMFMDDINKIFSPIFILQLFTSTSIICVIAFHASANASEGDSQILVMVLYLIAAFYQLFQFCWYGQRVQNESIQLPNSVYDCDWYKCSKKFKIKLHLFLLNVQKTVEISAYNLIVMSMETYLSDYSTTFALACTLKLIKDSIEKFIVKERWFLHLRAISQDFFRRSFLIG